MAAVERVRPDARLMNEFCHNGQRAMAYVWAREGAVQNGIQHARVRFFFPKDAAHVEDPGTGSACANLGGFLLASGISTPQTWRLLQGNQINKPCHLQLHLDADDKIFVSGRVIEIGCGTITLPS